MQTLVSEHLICTSCHYLADIMEALAGAALLEYACPWGWTFESLSICPTWSCSLCFTLAVEDVTSRLPALAPCCHDSRTIWAGACTLSSLSLCLSLLSLSSLSPSLPLLSLFSLLSLSPLARSSFTSPSASRLVSKLTSLSLDEPRISFHLTPPPAQSPPGDPPGLGLFRTSWMG